MDWFGKNTFGKIRYKNIGNLIFDGLAGTWFGDDTWTIATWTLSIELLATYLIYVAAQAAVQYRGRFFIYFAIILIFWMFQFLGFLDIVDAGGTAQKDRMLTRGFRHLPLFFIGVVFADIESLEKRPLDKVRNLSIWWKIPINTVLLAIFLVYGSYTGDDHCYTAYDDECDLWRYATIGGFIPKAVAMYAGSLAIFFLALTSGWTQWVFATPPF